MKTAAASASNSNSKLPLLNIVFWSVLGGIVFSFGMTVYTALHNRAHEHEIENAAKSMPLPADAPAPAKPIVPAQ